MIIVDSRESEKVRALLDGFGVKYEIRELLIGDYSVGDIIIERKAIADFYGSVYSGRVYRQVNDMCENYEKALLVISGTPAQYFIHRGKADKFKVFFGALASLAVKFRVGIVQVFNDYQFVLLLMALEMEGGKGVMDLDRVLYRSEGGDVYLGMLSQVPGVGLKKARAILGRYRFWELFDVSVGDLQVVDGVGPKLAKGVKAVFNKGV